MGAWIETVDKGTEDVRGASHPVWVRGLKQKMQLNHFQLFLVAPRVGAWIETPLYLRGFECTFVAPRVGAWIET